VGVFGEESHLTFRIATIGAVRVGLNDFPDRETIRGFLRRDSNVFAQD
jgi:hypothetical protein